MMIKNDLKLFFRLPLLRFFKKAFKIDFKIPTKA